MAINFAEVPAEDPFDALQARALDLNRSRTPSWFHFVSLDLPCQKSEVEKLPRCSCEAGWQRHLPYLRDMVNAVRSKAEPNDWIGVTNSDIIFAPKFFEQLKNSTASAIVTRRLMIDVSQLGEESPVGYTETWCMDCFLIRASLWDKCDIPDFIIGEPYWDPPMALFLAKYQHEEFKNGECLHVRHNATWRNRFTKLTTHNLRLAMSYAKSNGWSGLVANFSNGLRVRLLSPAAWKRAVSVSEKK